ncbi:MAG: hypothetical protein ABI333_12685 [bacterium]
MEQQEHSQPNAEQLSAQSGSLLVGALGDLDNIGRLWADHGLRVGAAALQSSALTLVNVAGMLSNLAHSIKK